MGNLLRVQKTHLHPSRHTETGQLDDGEDLETLGLTMVVDELEHFINSKPVAKSLISPLVGRSIGDLSIVAQCYRQLELYQPWAQEFERQAAQREKKDEKGIFGMETTIRQDGFGLCC